MAAAIIVAVTALAWARPLQSGPTLVVADQESGQIYYETAASDGLIVQLRWIHSIEKEPWVEIYRVEGEHLVLEETIIKSYGAGVEADPAGTTTVENGAIVTRGIARPVPDLRWVHSHRTKHQLTVGDHLIDTPDIPHHSFVTLKIKE